MTPILLLALLSAPPSPAYGLFVGISDYRRLGDLPFTDRDARRMASAFEALEGPLHVGPKNRIVLTDRAATRERVRAALADLAERAGADSAPGGATLVFFFSGHADGGGVPRGDTGGGGEALAFWGSDETPRGDLSAAELAESVAPFRRRVVILDACFSGGFARTIAGAKSLLLSAGPGFREVSTLAELESGGALSFTLLAGLGGGADSDTDGFLTEREVVEYLRAEVGLRCSECGRRIPRPRRTCPYDGNSLQGNNPRIAGGTGLSAWGRYPTPASRAPSRNR